MLFADVFMSWPASPFLSLLMWSAVALVLMYLARPFGHQAIRAFTRILEAAMRLASQSLLRAEESLKHRNQEVLLETGQEAAERGIEREFHRVNTVVNRDLSGYAGLHRVLADQIHRIDEDYREGAEVPPSPPNWVKAIEAVANIPPTGDSTVANILGDIHTTLNKQHKTAMEEYRKASQTRHSVLQKMMPYWRKLTHTLDDVRKMVIGLLERTSLIDQRMEEYEQIRAQTDKAKRMLASSSMTQFCISGFVLLIAIGGIVINFNLIALPMSEMVGGGSYIGPYKTSHVAALVIILVEVAMGLYLMETLRITRLFPIIGNLDDKIRTRMIWVTLSILVILASIEAALAFMRDQIAADIQALRQSLATVEAVEPVNRWIPTAAQMVMGFILPFALTYVAIPLESFVHSSRTVLGGAVAVMLRLIAFLLSLFADLFRAFGDMLVSLYDVLIAPALWIEKLIRSKGQQPTVQPTEEVLG